MPSNKSSIAERLTIALKENHMRQSEVVDKCKQYESEFNTHISRTDLSNYLKKHREPTNDKIALLAKTLNVNEVWLMGYSVPSDRDYYESDEHSQCPLFNSCYYKKPYEIVSLLMNLDNEDCSRVLGYIEGLLEKDKYRRR